MERRIEEQLELVNQQAREIDAIYHRTAVRFGLSDSVFWVLYVLMDTSKAYSQQDLCGGWSFPKQTIHSAIRTLEGKGLVRLEPSPGSRNRKVIRLTPEGRAFIQTNVVLLYAAEKRAVGRMEPEEMQAYLKLSEKYIACLQEEAEALPNTAQAFRRKESP